MPAEPLSLDALIERYDVFFLDAYGVLVRSDGALPGAADFLRRLEAAGKTYLLLSNDASRSVETSVARYRRFGLPLAADRILTSGLLLAPHFAQHGLGGARTIVLGTEDSEAYVRAAGGVVTSADDETAEVVVAADDDGYPFLEAVNDVITTLFRRLDRGLRTHLLLPNPDLLFPRAEGAYGFTAGAIAAMLEAILRLRAPAGSERFVALGKPHTPIFSAGLERSPIKDKRRIVMLGDQIVTDILGASTFGIDSVFLESGVGRLADAALHGVTPTWRLASLAG